MSPTPLNLFAVGKRLRPLVERGLSDRQIALKLDVHRVTVMRHRRLLDLAPAVSSGSSDYSVSRLRSVFFVYKVKTGHTMAARRVQLERLSCMDDGWPLGSRNVHRKGLAAFEQHGPLTRPAWVALTGAHRRLLHDLIVEGWVVKLRRVPNPGGRMANLYDLAEAVKLGRKRVSKIPDPDD